MKYRILNIRKKESSFYYIYRQKIQKENKKGIKHHFFCRERRIKEEKLHILLIQIWNWKQQTSGKRVLWKKAAVRE
jgi:hypothetical protein